MERIQIFSVFYALCCHLLIESQSLSEGDATWRVDLKQGSIEAPRIDLEGGRRHYYAFRGIPFAQPPTGSLRFKDPVQAVPWKGVRNGSIAAPACLQADLTGSEDCLCLNVFTPKRSATEFPVMVWIHGGGFLGGSAGHYEPTHLMREDVIVVVIQYRLGVFGFLSTEDLVIPGNMGLKDQVMALRWVQDNIESFGGDPNKVTIFGESAGGISVHYHMLSPMSKGLFHRAIAQSGTALYSGLPGNNHRHNAALMGQMLGCEGVTPVNLNSNVLYDCLKNVSGEDLLTAAGGFAKFMNLPQVMLPSVDGEFLPEHPILLVKDGRHHKVDFMIGNTRDEGAVFVRNLLLNDDLRQNLSRNFAVNGPIIFHLEEAGDLGIYIAKRLFYHYLGDLCLNEENAEDATKLFTDFIFAVPMDLVAKYHKKGIHYGSRIYLYELNHVGEGSFADSPNITIGKNWVAHGDDVQYLFDTPFFTPLKRPRDLFMSEIITSLWANFAKTGNPTPDLSLGFKWSPITSNELSYLMLQLSPFMRGFIREKELEFYTNLPIENNKLMFPERFKSQVCV